MTAPAIGIVTIGQTPRPDLEHAFARHAPGLRVEIRGALDGLPLEEIDAMAGSQDYPLLVRLADGATREIPLWRLHPLVALQAGLLAAAGVRVVAIACAGGFPDIACNVPVLLPGRILPALAAAIGAGPRIGIVTPIRAQVEAAIRKWTGDGFDPQVTSASPHVHAEIEAAARHMRDQNLGLVVLDCFGHDDDYADEFSRRSGALVLAAQSVTARLAGELAR